MGFLARGRLALLAHLRDPVYTNGYALVASSAAAAALGFLFWALVARLFPKEAVGLGVAVTSAATLAALVGKAGFDAAIIRYGPAASRRYLLKLLGYASVATVALTGLVALVMVPLARERVPELALLAEPAVAAGFLFLATGTALAWILDAYFISEQAAVAVLARNVAFNLVKLAVPFVALGTSAVLAIPLAWGVGLAASLGVALAWLPRRVASRPKEGAVAVPRRQVAVYAAKNYALNLSEFLPGLVLPIVVLAILGADANAEFYMAWAVANVAFLASKAVSQSSFAALVREGDPRPALRKGFRLSGMLLVPGILAILLGAELVLSAFGKDYGAQGATLLRLLALSVPAIVTLNIFLAYLKARHAGWELTLLPACSLVAFLAIVPFTLARYGIAGAGYAWLAVQSAAGLYAAVRLIAMLRRNHHDRPGTVLNRHPHEG